MMPLPRSLWGCIAVMAVLLLVLARQHPSQQLAPEPTSNATDVQDVVHQEQATIAEKQTEIQGLEMQLVNERTISKHVGLIQYEPGPWTDGWVATFYDGDKGINGAGTGITKSGLPASKDWTVAADIRLLPMGTIIEVQYGNWISEPLQVQDVGGAIQGKRLDIYVPSQADCLQLGRQTVRIRVLKPRR